MPLEQHRFVPHRTWVVTPLQMSKLARFWTDITHGLKPLSRLVRVLERRRNRLVDAVDGGARQKHKAVQKDKQRQAWQETGQTKLQANAAALQSDQQVISKLEQMIAARIGRPVRHVKSAMVPKSADKGFRAHVHQRAYTRHWFEVSGNIDGKLAQLVDADGLLEVFVKSGSKLGLCPPLEFILSEQGGNGFRVPYFFGWFALGDLEIGAWEAIAAKTIPFAKRSLADQTRIIEAIAVANAVPAERTVPVLTRWVDFGPRKFYSRFRFLKDADDALWKDLYARTEVVMKHHGRLVRQLGSGNERVLTHNDVSGDNVVVPPTGDVVIFDWEISTLSVPGADLGVLARTGAVADLLPCYLSKMARWGVSLDPDAVRFALEVTEGFRVLQRGWRKQSARHAEFGLTLLNRHL